MSKIARTLFSDIMRACVVTSEGESCGSSFGCVWIQPKGSMPRKYSCSGKAAGRHNAADLFDLRIIGRRDPVQVRRDLRPKIADHDESFQHVLGENVLRRDKQRTSTGVENAWRAR